MRLVCLSDTHTLHASLQVPEGDVLVHSGDFTNRGELREIAEFLAWFESQPHRHKILVAGNHEMSLDPLSLDVLSGSTPTSVAFKRRKGALDLLNASKGIHYLEDCSATIEGVFFYGSPWQPEFCNWAFNLPRKGATLKRRREIIPVDTEVLITHGPPHGILDDTLRAGPQGCELLAERIKELPNLKAHIFGHLHLNGGTTLYRDGVAFVNAAICTENYQPTNPIQVIDV